MLRLIAAAYCVRGLGHWSAPAAWVGRTLRTKPQASRWPHNSEAGGLTLQPPHQLTRNGHVPLAMLLPAYAADAGTPVVYLLQCNDTRKRNSSPLRQLVPV